MSNPVAFRLRVLTRNDKMWLLYKCSIIFFPIISASVVKLPPIEFVRDFAHLHSRDSIVIHHSSSSFNEFHNWYIPICIETNDQSVTN